MRPRLTLVGLVAGAIAIASTAAFQACSSGAESTATASTPLTAATPAPTLTAEPSPLAAIATATPTLPASSPLIPAPVPTFTPTPWATYVPPVKPPPLPLPPTPVPSYTPTPPPAPTPTPPAPEPTPTATPEPTPTATPEPTPTVTPEPTPTVTPEPTPTATPDPTPTATPEPTPTQAEALYPDWPPVDPPPADRLDGQIVRQLPHHLPVMPVLDALNTFINDEGAPLPDEEAVILAALFGMSPDQDPGTVMREASATYRAGRADAAEREAFIRRYLAILQQLPALQAEEAAARAAGWDPGFPGAPRLLFNGRVWGSDGESADPRWTADIGLALPPARVSPLTTLYRPFRHVDMLSAEERGFYPALRPGVNVAWALGVDIDEPSHFGECAPIKIERLNTAWSYPTGAPTILDSPGWAGYAARMGLDSRTPTVPLSGQAAVWVEEERTWYWRETNNTPYGWFTFDIETLQRRPVDTAPGSWDTRYLWEGDIFDKARLGVGTWDFVGHELDDPWPAFNPWIEIKDGNPTAPGIAESRSRYIGRELTEYMRITCE